MPNRHSKFFAVLLVAGALFAFGACKDKDSAQGGGDSPAAKGQFAYLPKDANWVVGMYPQQIASSTLFKQYVEPDLGKSAEYQKLKESCGFDPTTTVTGVVFGGNVENEAAVGAVKGITKAQFVKCVPALASEGDTPPKVTEEGEFVKIESGSDATWVGWADEKTAILRSDAKDKATIEAVLKTTEGLDKNENMMKLIGQVDSKAAIWFAVHNDKPDQPIQGVPVQAKALFGSVNFSQGLAVNFTIQQGSPEEAQNTVATMTPQLQAVKQMMPFLAKLEMKPEGSDVHVTLNLNNDELKELAPVLQQQLGGMMPMMGGGGHPEPVDPAAGDPGAADPAAADPAAADPAAADPAAGEAAAPEGE
jgi:hypothetical protein